MRLIPSNSHPRETRRAQMDEMTFKGPFRPKPLHDSRISPASTSVTSLAKHTTERETDIFQEGGGKTVPFYHLSPKTELESPPLGGTHGVMMFIHTRRGWSPRGELGPREVMPVPAGSGWSPWDDAGPCGVRPVPTLGGCSPLLPLIRAWLWFPCRLLSVPWVSSGRWGSAVSLTLPSSDLSSATEKSFPAPSYSA